jgi:hypothetical protein
LAYYGLLKAIRRGDFRGGKHFKKLKKWLRRVNSPRVMYITLTDPERI